MVLVIIQAPILRGMGHHGTAASSSWMHCSMCRSQGKLPDGRTLNPNTPKPLNPLTPKTLKPLKP